MSVPMSTVWLILFVIFVVAELATSGALVSVWFCFGALAAMVAARSGLGLIAQIVIFLVISIALLAMTKPIVKKFLKQKSEPTNSDRLIGGHGIVLEDIDNLVGSGSVKIDGKIWSAKSSSEDVKIKAGTEVTVKDIKGVKIIVENFIKE